MGFSLHPHPQERKRCYTRDRSINTGQHKLRGCSHISIQKDNETPTIKKGMI